jgi:hypothetical protein
MIERRERVGEREKERERERFKERYSEGGRSKRERDVRVCALVENLWEISQAEK